jgi:hypothetical protein
MERLQQKNNLNFKLGMLFGPLQRLIEKPDEYDEQERSQIIARYNLERETLLDEFREFCNTQPGHDYEVEYLKFYIALIGLTDDILYERDELPDIIPRRLSEALAAIDAIPIPRNSAILEAGTPFTTYCRLRDLCEAEATRELIWIDAYLDSNVFHRFLRNVRPQVSVTLVTAEPKKNGGNRDQRRWTEFLDISRLYAQERGHAYYRLVVHQGLLHDRWLLLDGKKLYSFGGSAKDAGNKQCFTISQIDSSAENLQIIQTHVDNGTEYFGPSTPQHYQ